MLGDAPQPLEPPRSKENEKIMRRGNGRREEGEKKELFLQPVINQYSSRMLPACAIIINYTQERSWRRKRRAGEGGGIKGLCSRREIRM